MSDIMNEKDYPLLFKECLSSVELSKYKSGSHKKMDWKCSSCGHMWTTEIRVRAQKGCGCPHCNNGEPISLDKPARRAPQKVKREYSLGYLYPELAEMWDNDKNEYSAFGMNTLLLIISRGAPKRCIGYVKDADTTS